MVALELWTMDCAGITVQNQLPVGKLPTVTLLYHNDRIGSRIFPNFANNAGKIVYRKFKT